MPGGDLHLSIAATRLGEPVDALRVIEACHAIWQIGLILVAIHLFLIWYLTFTSGFMAKVFGILLVLTGIGYAVGSFGVVLIPGFTTFPRGFFFVGEMALIFWRLTEGRRLTDRTGLLHGHDHAPG